MPSYSPLHGKVLQPQHTRLSDTSPGKSYIYTLVGEEKVARLHLAKIGVVLEKPTDAESE